MRSSWRFPASPPRRERPPRSPTATTWIFAPSPICRPAPGPTRHRPHRRSPGRHASSRALAERRAISEAFAGCHRRGVRPGAGQSRHGDCRAADPAGFARPGGLLRRSARAPKAAVSAATSFAPWSAMPTTSRKSCAPAISGKARFSRLTTTPELRAVGRFIRRYSLDELPQLWNVLRGEMSLVGPRPHPVDEVNHYELQHYRRLDVKPGITGLWQITARDCSVVRTQHAPRSHLHRELDFASGPAHSRQHGSRPVRAGRSLTRHELADALTLGQ